MTWTARLRGHLACRRNGRMAPHLAQDELAAEEHQDPAAQAEALSLWLVEAPHSLQARATSDRVHAAQSQCMSIGNVVNVVCRVQGISSGIILVNMCTMHRYNN